MKVIAASHYSWISQEGGQKPLLTVADSLAAYRTRGSGGGTYRLTDTSYVERLDLFYDPREVGREVEISCRIAGNRWDASFEWPLDDKGNNRIVHVQEIWRRVE